MSESYPDLNANSQTYGDKAAAAKDTVITSKVSYEIECMERRMRGQQSRRQLSQNDTERLELSKTCSEGEVARESRLSAASLHHNLYIHCNY